MPDLINFNIGEKFSVRVFFSLLANPDRQWTCNFEMHAQASGTLDDIIAAVDKFVDWAKTISPTWTKVDRVTVSTWVPDSQPYDPASFYVKNVNEAGTWARTGMEPVSINTTLWINRSVLTGRQGKLLLRGVLAEQDLTAPSGDDVLNTTLIASQWTTAVEHLSSLMENGGTSPLLLSMISTTGNEVVTRPVTALEIRGVMRNKHNHKYFNRASQAPGGNEV